MKICFIPIDNRPVCYTLAENIIAMDKSLELFIPPREYLGNLIKNACVNEILDWLKNIPKVDVIILSLDTLIYGGLIPSRRGAETFEELKLRLNKVKEVLKEKGAKIYAFSSIMRISNNNYNEEEKEYWSEYGKKIFEYSYNTHKNKKEFKTDIPLEILEDYLNTRKRNFEINKLYLKWQKEGLFDTLIFSKDDCAEFGFNVQEAQELEKLGGKTKTGADEIPLSLLARSIEKDIKIFIKFTEPEYKDKISNYEDTSIENSVLGQLELGGFKVVHNEDEADLFLVVNNFVERQGELVMGWSTLGKYNGNFVPPEKPYAFADVRFANGADNDFVEDILPKIDKNFYGYSGWNTSANTLGSLLAGVKVKYRAEKYDNETFVRLQMIRFLDDWAYQANIRGQIETPCNISDLMKPYEERLADVLGFLLQNQIIYSYPWNRKFEVEVCL